MSFFLGTLFPVGIITILCRMPRRFRRASAYRSRRRSSKGGSLTGGTGDVNPQWFNLGGAGVAYTDANPIAAKNSYNTYTVPIQPAAMMSAGKGRTMVMEILRVEFQLSGAMGSQNTSLQAAICSRAPGAAPDITLGKPHVLASIAFDPWDISGGSGGAAYQIIGLKSVDVTDDTGHGIIFAGQTIFLALENPAVAGANGTPATHALTGRILFRWKNVSLQEYIGVVTSQLSS